jgi:hypothetical protein
VHTCETSASATGQQLAVHAKVDKPATALGGTDKAIATAEATVSTVVHLTTQSRYARIYYQPSFTQLVRTFTHTGGTAGGYISLSLDSPVCSTYHCYRGPGVQYWDNDNTPTFLEISPVAGTGLLPAMDVPLTLTLTGHVEVSAETWTGPICSYSFPYWCLTQGLAVRAPDYQATAEVTATLPLNGLTVGYELSPGEITGFTVTGTKRSITYTWTKPLSPAPLLGYHVVRSDPYDGSTSIDLPASATSYKPVVPSGTSACYVITPFNSYGDGPGIAGCATAK